MFWCTEAAFEQLAGVLDVESGYTGGAAETANYRRVCDGNTGTPKRSALPTIRSESVTTGCSMSSSMP